MCPERIILRALSFFYTIRVSDTQNYRSDGGSSAVALVECGWGPAAVEVDWRLEPWGGGWGTVSSLGLTRFY